MAEVDLQVATGFRPVPELQDFHRWAAAALQGRENAELTIRLVDREESRRLNKAYRGIDKPTNVLSFPAEVPEPVELPLLGDIVICALLVAEEAAERGIPVMDHWAHLTIHGILHLLGYDHQSEDEAVEMEALEARLLASLGISDPYDAEKILE